MAPPEPEQGESMEMGLPQPKAPVSLCGSFPNLTVLTHDGSIFKLIVKRKWFKIVSIEWAQIQGPLDSEVGS